MGRLGRLCFGNFLEEVVGDFAGVEEAAARSNPAMAQTWEGQYLARR